MKVNHVIVAIFFMSQMSFNSIRENKILVKISEFIVSCFCLYSVAFNPFPVSTALPPEASSIMRALSGARCTDARLYAL